MIPYYYWNFVELLVHFEQLLGQAENLLVPGIMLVAVQLLLLLWQFQIKMLVRQAEVLRHPTI